MLDWFQIGVVSIKEILTTYFSELGEKSHTADWN